MKISKSMILNALFVLSITIIISLLLVTHHTNTYGTQATEFKHSPTHHVDYVLATLVYNFERQRFYNKVDGDVFAENIDLSQYRDKLDTFFDVAVFMAHVQKEVIDGDEVMEFLDMDNIFDNDSFGESDDEDSI